MLSLQLEKLHAIGLKPVLLLGKETRKKERQCEILTPRCTLPAYAQDYLDKIVTFYEYLCEGWTQDSTGQGVAEDPDEERVTLNLTPCDPSEPTNNWQEAGTTESQVPETSTVQVEVLKAPPREAAYHQRGGAGGRDHREPGAGDKHRAGGGAEGPPLKQRTNKEVGQEARTTESQVPETSTVQVEVLKTPP
ncbi:hypothetical protein NQZ68_033871 [Dissostichus eleginoides]|nr:hypothetical protein NQZ68_033871 [Dissostichus eleginoides]